MTRLADARSIDTRSLDAFTTPTALARLPGYPTRATICRLAALGRIHGALRLGHLWLIPRSWVFIRRPGGWRTGRKRKTGS